MKDTPSDHTPPPWLPAIADHVEHLPLGETRAMSNHASVASVIGYHRAGEALTSRGGRLLDT